MILKENETGLDFAYCRVSTRGQDIDRQHYLLDNLNINIPHERRIVEKISGRVKLKNRPELRRLFKDVLRKGDRLIVTSASRLSRELFHLLEIMNELQSMGVELVMLDMHIDPEHPIGKFILNIMGSVYQLESDFASYRTKQGQAAARERGSVIGRKKGATVDQKEFLKFFNSFKDQHEGIQESIKKFSKTEVTIRRWLKENGIEIPRRKRGK